MYKNELIFYVVYIQRYDRQNNTCWLARKRTSKTLTYLHLQSDTHSALIVRSKHINHQFNEVHSRAQLCHKANCHVYMCCHVLYL